jgi:hypothetical protein
MFMLVSAGAVLLSLGLGVADSDGAVVEADAPARVGAGEALLPPPHAARRATAARAAVEVRGERHDRSMAHAVS